MKYTEVQALRKQAAARVSVTMPTDTHMSYNPVSGNTDLVKINAPHLRSVIDSVKKAMAMNKQKFRLALVDYDDNWNITGVQSKSAKVSENQSAFQDVVLNASGSSIASKYPLSSKDKAILLAAILKEYRQRDIEQAVGKGRDLYVSGVTRYDDVPVSLAEIYPDIRDKKDPKFRFDKAVGHYTSWYPGTDFLMYNG